MCARTVKAVSKIATAKKLHIMQHGHATMRRVKQPGSRSFEFALPSCSMAAAASGMLSCRRQRQQGQVLQPIPAATFLIQILRLLEIGDSTYYILDSKTASQRLGKSVS